MAMISGSKVSLLQFSDTVENTYLVLFIELHLRAYLSIQYKSNIFLKTK